MKPAPFLFPTRRAPALLAVLLLHLLAGGLLLQEARRPAEQRPTTTQLRLIRPKPLPLSPTAAAAPRFRPPTMQGQAPTAITLPNLPVEPSAPAGPATATTAASAPAAPPPLDLRLPARMAAPPPPTLADQIRADGRANSPRETAVDRMANALGARGWTVLELSDGGRKVTGPFGECQIIRPSMVDGIAGHPHAGLLPPRVFPCGGIEKGSLKHERPN